MALRIFLVGGTGFIGRHLAETLVEKGVEVWALVRSRQKIARLPDRVRPVLGDAMVPGPWQDEAARCAIGINLAGANIFRRWNEEYKRLILDSRVISTHLLGEALSRGEGRILLNASAVGYYGDTGEKEVDESHPPGHDFLAQVCKSWEETALHFQGRLRVCVTRFGIVLGRDGGALLKMLPAFRLGLGGPLGSGQQWFPWIHIQDLVSAILFLMEREDLSGIFNLVAPQAVRQRELARVLGRVLRRPAFLPLPGWGLRMIFGEVSMILMASCRARPRRLLEAGFKFLYPNLDKALRDLLKRGG